ncbi:larval cuticle protein LCP-17-like [Drosophila sulfurigaster albostrigata]|uniref:larval cuticle protein LCP-17-like n=1 Tax=Drosophila sulfurigaster albostrigata TaxID=89887 RepID=UPI002D218F97|nr:larval cuticle protein LCP-17-like [Drosophila sulfurigaster albostrigata]
MLKTIVCLFLVASGVSCASVGSTVNVVGNFGTVGRQASDIEKPIVQLLSYKSDKNPDGSYSFAYEGDDNSYRHEQASLADAGTEDEALEVQGSYRYVDADGQTIEVHYTAGKNGFVPFGTNIPSEISLNAKAAADLPNVNTYEEEQELKLKQRRSRAQTDVKQHTESRPQLKAATSQIVPVKVLVEEKPVAKVEQPEKSKKVAV